MFENVYWKLDILTVNHTVLSIISLEAEGFLSLNIIICFYFLRRFYQFQLEGLMESVNGTVSEYSLVF